MADMRANQYDDPNKVLPADPAAGLVYDNYLRSKNELVDKVRPKMNELYKAYRAYVEKKDDLIQSNLVIPMAFTQVEAFAARTISNRPRVEVWPRGVEDHARATGHRAKIDYDWDHMDVPWKLLNFVKSGLIYGSSWMKAYYRKETRVRMQKQERMQPKTYMLAGIPIQMGQEIIQEEVEVEVPVWDDPDVDTLELDEVFPDPDGKDVDACAWIIHRYTATLAEIEGLQNTDGTPLYEKAVVAKLKKLASNNSEMNKREDSLRDARDTVAGTSTSGSVDPHKRRFTLLEMWSDEKVTTICEEFLDLKPLRNGRNKYGIKPFIIYTPIPDPNSLLGISMVEVLYSLQKETSTLHNARMDHVLQTVHAMMTIRRGSNVNPKNIRVRPRGYTFVDEHDDINWLRPPALEFSLYREDDQLQTWAQKAGGATDTFVGVHSKQSGRTATEASLLSQSSGSRAGLMLQILVIQSLNRLGRILIRINEEEMTEERQLPSISADLQPTVVGRGVLQGGSNLDLDVRIDVAQTEPETRLFKRKESLEAIQILGGLYKDPNHPLIQRFILDLAETYDINNAEELIKVPVVPQKPTEAQPQQGGGGGGMAEQLAAALGGQGRGV